MHYLEVKYETSPQLPPPYCYYYHIKGRMADGKLQIKFDWIYHHREDISEEEIQEEGFTGADDFHWKGYLNEVWGQLFQKKILITRQTYQGKQDQPYLHLTMRDEEKVLFDGEPRQLEDWEYFLQELIQAIYETAGKEAPLQIRFYRVSPDGGTAQASLQMHFSDRTVKIAAQRGKQQLPAPTFSWEAIHPVLEAVYGLDYSPEQALAKEPKHTGFYLDTGEGTWYVIGKSAGNPTRQKDYITTLSRFFDSLFPAS